MYVTRLFYKPYYILHVLSNTIMVSYFYTISYLSQICEKMRYLMESFLRNIYQREKIIDILPSNLFVLRLKELTNYCIRSIQNYYWKESFPQNITVRLSCSIASSNDNILDMKFLFIIILIPLNEVITILAIYR